MINADNEVFSDKMVVFILDEIRTFNQQNLNSCVLVEKSKIFARKNEKQILRQAENSICLIFFKKVTFDHSFSDFEGKEIAAACFSCGLKKNN